MPCVTEKTCFYAHLKDLKQKMSLLPALRQETNSLTMNQEVEANENIDNLWIRSPYMQIFGVNHDKIDVISEVPSY